MADYLLELDPAEPVSVTIFALLRPGADPLMIEDGAVVEVPGYPGYTLTIRDETGSDCDGLDHGLQLARDGRAIYTIWRGSWKECFDIAMRDIPKLEKIRKGKEG